MKQRVRYTFRALVWALMLLAAYAATTHAQTQAAANLPAARKGSPAQPAGINPAGAGAAGQIPKWTSLNGIGHSIIAEDKFGRVGIRKAASSGRAILN